MAAYCSLNSAVTYKDVKKAILHCYYVNEESKQHLFHSDCKMPEEFYKN